MRSSVGRLFFRVRRCGAKHGVAPHNVRCLELLEPPKDIGLVTLHDGPDGHRSGSPLERAPFHLKVSLDIRVEGFEVSVAQDVLDGHRRDPGLQHVHGLRMPEAVRTNPLPRQRRAPVDRTFPIVVQQKRRARSGQRLSSIVSKEPLYIAW